MLTLESMLEGPFWSISILGNSVATFVEAVIVFFVILVVLKILQVLVIGRLRVITKNTKTDVDDFLVKLIVSVRPSFYVVVAFYGGLRFLDFSDFFVKTINIILLIWIVYQIVGLVQTVIDYVVRKRLDSEVGAENASRLLGGIAKFVLYALGFLLILQNSGVNVTSLIAGIGVGGIAIAFALQKILEDLFSSFAIYFDRPFEVGDMIKTGTSTGKVEKIGIKTTRLRSPEGEEIVIANRVLTDATLQNFRRLDERRAKLTFGVLYETPQKMLEKIPDMVQAEIEGVKGVRPHREHFISFGDSSLDFQVTYFVESDDYDNYLDLQQAVNFAIFKRFASEGISMAYPTRTIYMNR